MGKDKKDKKDKRAAPRIQVKFKVEMSHPELGTVLTNTRDISEGGAFVFAGQEVCPGLNQRIQLKVIGLPGEAASQVESEVVRVENEGIGVKFVVDEHVTDEDDEDFLNALGDD